MKNINGQTQVYGILGNPISHSLSPLFQNHFLEKADVNACYLPYLVNPEQLEQTLHGLHAAHVQGLNITIPHKENILSLVRADKDAQTIGAVNTLKRNNDGWSATNTDWQGFASVIKGLQVDVSQTPVLLFGAGGTSRAILHALHHQGAKDVFICNRNITRAQSLASSLQSTYPNMNITPLAWDSETVAPHIQTCQLIINSTSIGLDEQDAFPFPLTGNGFAIDAVYKPHGNTVFCKAAHNYTSVDGLPMLIAQGIASFAFWFEDELRIAAFHLPNNQVALQWVEQELGRTALKLPGWRA
ncbi:MAG TPA: shikimate dehydrogenase [Ghiorsea sp.]|nr:shikimate dehydrogenase [Ghiorsea sp.]HIP06612.1 shikimate dehydrogenase [Mariprofundaceae bacterium]